MNFNKYQKLAWKTAQYPNAGNNIYYPALGLGEAGEIQNKVKKIMRDHNNRITPEMRAALKKEIGDLIWYVAAMCTELGIGMDDVASENIEKLADRQQRGVIKGSGDDR